MMVPLESISYITLHYKTVYNDKTVYNVYNEKTVYNDKTVYNNKTKTAMITPL